MSGRPVACARPSAARSTAGPGPRQQPAGQRAVDAEKGLRAAWPACISRHGGGGRKQRRVDLPHARMGKGRCHGLGRRLCERGAHPGRRGVSAALGRRGGGVPRGAGRAGAGRDALWRGACRAAGPVPAGGVAARPGWSSCMAAIGSASAGRTGRIWRRAAWRAAGRWRCRAIRSARGSASPGSRGRSARPWRRPRRSSPGRSGLPATRRAGISSAGCCALRRRCRRHVAARIEHTVSISGVHDLRPLLRTRLNEALRLDGSEARAESPALLEPREGVRLAAWVGGRRAAGVRPPERAARQHLDRARRRDARRWTSRGGTIST